MSLNDIIYEINNMKPIPLSEEEEQSAKEVKKHHFPLTKTKTCFL